MPSPPSMPDPIHRVCEPAWRRHRFRPEGKRMVGIGTGLAELSRSLAARFGLVLALEERPGDAEDAKRRCADVPNLRFTVAREESLRLLPDASVDLCLLSPAFACAPEREAARRHLREAARILRPGGLVHLRLGEEGVRDAERSIARSGLVPVEFVRTVEGESWALARKPWGRQA